MEPGMGLHNLHDMRYLQMVPGHWEERSGLEKEELMVKECEGPPMLRQTLNALRGDLVAYNMSVHSLDSKFVVISPLEKCTDYVCAILCCYEAR